MRRQLLMVVAAALAVAAGQPPKDTPVDKDKLQGTWKAVSIENQAGKRDAPEGMQLAFAGDKFAMKSPAGEIKGSFKLDTSKKPAQIDMTVTEGPDQFKGTTSEGIVTVDGDDLKWCCGEPGVKGRPTEFSTKEAATHMLVVLKREKK